MFRPIYPPRGRAQEYCDWAVNIYTGCPHACSYCFVPACLRKTPETFHSDVRPRPGILEAVQKQLQRPEWAGAGKKIMLCFTCDPYPMGHDSTPTRELIRLIKESGNHVQILTKGDATARRDFDLLDRNDSFGVTLTGGEHLELGASLEVTRIGNLKTAHTWGIPTWVSAEPVFKPECILGAIKNLDYVGLWRIGKLNHRKSDIDWCQFGHDVEALCKRLGRNYYIKEDLRKAMEARHA